MSPRPTFNLARFLLDEANPAPRHDSPQLSDDHARMVWDFASNSPVMTGGLHVADLQRFVGAPSQRAGVDSFTSSTGAVFNLTRPGDVLSYALQQNLATSLMSVVAPTSLGSAQITPLTQAGAQWAGENAGSDITEMTPTASTANLALKTLQATGGVSRQVLFTALSGGVDATKFVQNAIARLIAVAIDLAAFNGLGSASNQPLGLLQNTAIATVAMGSNGAALDIATCAALDLAVANTNAPGPRSFVTTPSVEAKAKATAAFTSGGAALWTDNNTLAGRAAYATTSLPSNLTKGTTTGCSALLLGAFQDAILGIAPVFGLLVDPYSKKNQNMLEITATVFVDVAIARAGSFRRVLDVIGS